MIVSKQMTIFVVGTLVPAAMAAVSLLGCTNGRSVENEKLYRQETIAKWRKRFEAELEKLPDPDTAAAAREQFVLTLARMGDFEPIREWLEKPQDAARKDRVYRGFLVILASHNRFDEALEMAQTLTDPGKKSIDLFIVVRELANAGQFERAKEVAETIPDDTLRLRETAWVQIGIACARRGDAAGTKEARSNIEDRDNEQLLNRVVERVEEFGFDPIHNIKSPYLHMLLSVDVGLLSSDEENNGEKAPLRALAAAQRSDIPAMEKQLALAREEIEKSELSRKAIRERLLLVLAAVGRDDEARKLFMEKRSDEGEGQPHDVYWMTRLGMADDVDRALAAEQVALRRQLSIFHIGIACGELALEKEADRQYEKLTDPQDRIWLIEGLFHGLGTEKKE